MMKCRFHKSVKTIKFNRTMKHVKILFFVFLAILIINGCKKEYSIENNGHHVPIGTWQFNDSSKLFSGNMDSAYIESSTSLNTKILHLLGTSLDGSQTFNMELYADTLKTGSYLASLFQSTFLYSAGGTDLYQAGQLIGEFTVNITSLTNNSISGTFSGSTVDSAGNLKQITFGKFTSSLNQSGSGTTVSTGVLGDSSGNCKPATVAGAYVPGVALNAGNTVQVQVTVAAAGSYSITTNVVNGISFSKAGTFTSTGPQTVTLNGSGTPVNSGSQSFTVKYGNSQCSFTVNFASPAVGVLGGGGGDCTPFAIAGTYQQGIALSATNTVQIQVTVSTPGLYTISTNTVDGVTFSSSGTFANTGVQSVTLTSSGTASTSGVKNFTVTFGSSNCTFSITFLPGVAPSADYFPLTLNSNWTYGLAGGTVADSVYDGVIGYSPTFGGNVYNTIGAYNVPPAVAFDSSYYRKPGGDYYQYAIYSNYLPFDQTVSGEYIFLKDNVPSGTSWTSPNITGSFNGTSITANIKMTILAKAVPVTIGTFNFPDVIKVKYEYFVVGSPTPLETDERWFAKNVGEIHQSLSNGTVTYTYDIGNFHIF